MSYPMLRRSLRLLLACALVTGCAKSSVFEPDDGGGGDVDAGPSVEQDADVDTDSGADTDAGSDEDGGLQADSGLDSGVDSGVDAGPPPCTDTASCDDGSDCTADSCDVGSGICLHDNPDADCDRFEGAECAGDLATELLTIDQTICIPGFALSLEQGSFSLCEGRRCNAADTQDGCLITLTSVGHPATETNADTLRLSGAITGVVGSVPFEGVIPDPTGSGTTIPIACTVSIGVGSGLPITADLALTGATACGTDRTVAATSNVDLSMLRVNLSGSGSIYDIIACAALNTALQGQVGTLITGAEPQIESGIDAALSALNCGTCDTSCVADLVCGTP